VPMIQRVSKALHPVALSVTAVASTAGAYEDLGITTIGDLRPGLGPLGGLDAALADRVARYGEGWLLLASCDLAEPDAGLARVLLDHVTPDAKAVSFKGERWEPLFALYHSSLRPLVSRQLESKRRALWTLIENVQGVAVPFPDGVTHIAQVNTPSDHRHFDGEG